ncbi:hypothetical protein EDC53_102336 [Phytobacter diazotrophicus]|jgi:hypothetical protein|nr:hypothetical protein EDC53_102336 [Phytobacter diazotrophicus]
MSVTEFLITPVWHQITDGTQDAKIHVLKGVLYTCYMLAQHDITEKYCVVTKHSVINSSHPVWCRSPWRGTRISVSI